MYIDARDFIEEVIEMENVNGDTIVAFMKQMQIQLSKDIKNTNDNLSQKMTEINEEMKNLNNKIDDVKDETEAVTKVVKKNHAEATTRMSRMEIRIERIEHEKENQEQQKRTRE